MRLFAVHDNAGTIYEVVMCPPDVPVPVLGTAPGLMFTEIEPPETVSEDTDLREFGKNHRVDVIPQQQKRSAVRLETPASY